MRSLEKRFHNISEKNPYWSSCTCFIRAVIGQRFSKQTIHRWFNKLVDKDDYAHEDKRALLAQIEKITKPNEDNQN